MFINCQIDCVQCNYKLLDFLQNCYQSYQDVDIFVLLSLILRCTLISEISDMRERLTGELTSMTVEHSGTYKSDEEKNGAALAIDLDLETAAHTKRSEDSAWLKVTLDQMSCVRQVNRHNKLGEPNPSWTCTSLDCSDCSGDVCSKYSVTLSSEGTPTDGLPPVTDCKYGDTVMITTTTGASFTMTEISVIGHISRSVGHL